MYDSTEVRKLANFAQEVKEQFQVSGIFDPNVKLFSALAVAQDQLEYAANILKKREDESFGKDQGRLAYQEYDPLTTDVGSVIITPAVELDLYEPKQNWCDDCDNPANSCTCGRMRHA